MNKFTQDAYNIEVIEEVLDFHGVQYFKGYDYTLEEHIDIKLIDTRIYTRMKVGNYDCDFECDGLTDPYFYIGEIKQPLEAVFLG